MASHYHGSMIGGLQVRGNLLCVTWSAGRGHVFLYDLDERRRVSSWTTPVSAKGYSDAAGVAIDARFRLFVADPHNDCVRRYNAFGQHLGNLGLPPPATGDRGRDTQGVLDRPHGLAIWHDRLYVAMGDQPRRRGVQCFYVDGRALPGLAARGDRAEKFHAPRALFCDRRGIVVADTLRGRLQRFRHDGGFVQEYELGEPGELVRPIAVVRLRDGGLLVADRGGDGPALRRVGVDGSTGAAGELEQHCRAPTALAVDEQDRVYVLDHDGERVVRATAELRFEQCIVDLAEHDRDAPEPRP